MEMKELEKLTGLVLISDKAQELVREKFECKDIYDLISKVAKAYKVSEEEAKKIITDSPRLMRIAFIVA
jgi:hypothetical protein